MSDSKPKRRFYIHPENISDDSTVIAQPEYHHIVDVIRYKEGGEICLFDGKGNEYLGNIVSIDRDNKNINVRIKKVLKEKMLEKPIILIQSLIKGSKMDFVVQKATEMGVTHIFPVKTERSVVKLDFKKENAKVNKWNRIIQEASKQCGRSEFPVMDRIWKLDEVLDTLDWVGNKIICTIQSRGASLKDISDKKTKSVAVAIGPEGGFTEKEVERAQSKGWVSIRAGNVVLRTETAAIAMLSVLSYKFGYWD